MTCHPCAEKWKRYYLSKGFNCEQAELMARKVVVRVEARERKERNRTRYLHVKSLLYKWTFIINVKATILHSFLHRRLVWIGKSYNPDYTQNCNACPTGNCNNGVPCAVPADCRICPSTTCPAPSDPNSSLVSNTCACTGTAGCVCSRVTEYECAGTTPTCNLSGICGYNCNNGYAWNGSACVLVAAAARRYGDGFIWVAKK